MGLNPLRALFDLVGITPLMVMSSEEVATMTDKDIDLLRDLEASDALLGQVFALSRVPGRRLVIDFVEQRVRVESDP